MQVLILLGIVTLVNFGATVKCMYLFQPNSGYRVYYPKELQNEVYKACSAILMFIGFCGFVPGLIIGPLLKGYPIRVSDLERHEAVNHALWIHLFSALPFIPLCMYQFYSGGVAELSSSHVKSGYAMVLLWTFIMGIAAEVWAFQFSLLDFPTIYTTLIFVCVTTNFWLGVYYARKKIYATHKDFMLMGILWVTDAGLFRSVEYFLKGYQFVCDSIHIEGDIKGNPLIVRILDNFTLVWIILFTMKRANRNGIQLHVNAAIQFLAGSFSFFVVAWDLTNATIAIIWTLLNMILILTSWRLNSRMNEVHSTSVGG